MQAFLHVSDTDTIAYRLSGQSHSKPKPHLAGFLSYLCVQNLVTVASVLSELSERHTPRTYVHTYSNIHTYIHTYIHDVNIKWYKHTDRQTDRQTDKAEPTAIPFHACVITSKRN